MELPRQDGLGDLGKKGKEEREGVEIKNAFWYSKIH